MSSTTHTMTLLMAIENFESNETTPQANLNIIIGNTDFNMLLDYTSGCTLIDLTLAKTVIYFCIQAKWPRKKTIRTNTIFKQHHGNILILKNTRLILAVGEFNVQNVL